MSVASCTPRKATVPWLPRPTRARGPKSHLLSITDEDFQVVHAARKVAGGRRPEIKKRKARNIEALGFGGDAQRETGGDARGMHRVQPRVGESATDTRKRTLAETRGLLDAPSTSHKRRSRKSLTPAGLPHALTQRVAGLEHAVVGLSASVEYLKASYQTLTSREEASQDQAREFRQNVEERFYANADTLDEFSATNVTPCLSEAGVEE
eukprot:351105-Chlamydomonas_euryale.AAC.4